MVKETIKSALLATGVWHSATLLRSLPSFARYVGGGLSGAAPHPIKMRIVRSYARRYPVQVFVETGTYLGETLRFVADLGIRCISIELSQELHQRARRVFASRPNVTLVQGDSGVRLPELLQTLTVPALFWLDGHYSGGVTSSADIHSPINAELDAILRHPIDNHVVLIDDARLFTGADGYPHMDELLAAVRRNGRYDAEVSSDIIRLLPKRAS